MNPRDRFLPDVVLAEIVEFVDAEIGRGLATLTLRAVPMFKRRLGRQADEVIDEMARLEEEWQQHATGVYALLKRRQWFRLQTRLYTANGMEHESCWNSLNTALQAYSDQPECIEALLSDGDYERRSRINQEPDGRLSAITLLRDCPDIYECRADVRYKVDGEYRYTDVNYAKREQWAIVKRLTTLQEWLEKFGFTDLAR